MDLNFIKEIARLLNTGRDVVRDINTTLVMICENHEFRNAMLLVRDTVTNKYFIELAPEIDEAQRNEWNRHALERPTSLMQSFQHPMLLTPDDATLFRFPKPPDLVQQSLALLMHPVVGQNQALPLGILCVQVPRWENPGHLMSWLELLATLIALSMQAKGMTSTKIYELGTPMPPTIVEGIVGRSQKMKEVGEVIKKVSTSRATVLIRGESGTGKELIAKAIHRYSLRHNAPFVSVNCAALSASLLESELFGHEKGAFTGALKERKGRFELADGGTLFLDEIGDTSLEFQTKLLRVLQEGQFERLGATQTLHVDVRLICATNADLELAIQRGTFREDLFYRLNVIPILSPPLRDRKDDIPQLVQFFLMQLNQEYGNSIQIREEDLPLLQNLDWPGNIRELENTVHSAFVMESQGYLNVRGALQGLRQKVSDTPPVESLPATTWNEERPFNVRHSDLQTNRPESLHAREEDSIEDEETQAIEMALAQAKGVQVRAAEYLGISLRQLQYRIKKYNIKVRKIRR